MRVRDYHTYNPLHNPLWFSLTPTSSYLNPWEVDSPNTYHTHPKCKVRFWCRWEALEEAICLLDAIGLNCVFRRAREDKASSSQLVVGAWKAQVHRVDQAWRIFCFYVLQLILYWIDLPLQGWRTSFSPRSSITRRHVILCLHSSSLLF